MSTDRDKKEDFIEVLGAVVLITLMLSGLIWYVGSNRIVYWLAPVFGYLGKMWSLVPGGSGRAHDIARVAAAFRADSGAVRFSDWYFFVSMCIKPAVYLAFLGMVTFFAFTVGAIKGNVRRRFSSDTDRYLFEMSKVFTGTAPILHIRKQLAQHTDPLWRKQTSPEEVLEKVRVDGKPLVVDGKLDLKRADAYFSGFDGVPAGGWPRSKMLGSLAVDLTRDVGRKVVYSDRFSPAGKVMYALLCAYAFGDKKDYEKARDQLNNSCRGAKSGMANLQVADWLYQKYRLNETARKLFAIHHWEYTYLYALFFHAKGQGKITHPQFLWLKPMSRVLFYVLNTVGRYTPHTESAAAFSQFAFEVMCARNHRLPLMRGEDGQLRPSICVRPASEGLEQEWERLLESLDDDDEWWKDEAVWKRVNRGYRVAAALPPAEKAVDTPFDQSMRAQQADADKREEAKLHAEMGDLMKDLSGL